MFQKWETWAEGAGAPPIGEASTAQIRCGAALSATAQGARRRTGGSRGRNMNESPVRGSGRVRAKRTAVHGLHFGRLFEGTAATGRLEGGDWRVSTVSEGRALALRTPKTAIRKAPKKTLVARLRGRVGKVCCRAAATQPTLDVALRAAGEENGSPKAQGRARHDSSEEGARRGCDAEARLTRATACFPLHAPMRQSKIPWGAKDNGLDGQREARMHSARSLMCCCRAVGPRPL